MKCGKMCVASGPSWGEGFFSLYFDFTYSLPCVGEGFRMGYIVLDPSNFSLSYNVIINKGRDRGSSYSPTQRNNSGVYCREREMVWIKERDSRREGGHTGEAARERGKSRDDKIWG